MHSIVAALSAARRAGDRSIKSRHNAVLRPIRPMVTRSTPHAIEMLAELVASPSVSCTVPELDQSN